MVQVAEKYSKFLISALILAFAVVALFWGGDIFGFKITGDFEAKVLALIPLALAVVAVLGTKNATPDAIDKAIMQLVLGGLSVASFWHEISPDLGVKIGSIVYAAVGAYFVWRKANAKVTVAAVHHVKDLPG